MTNPRLQGDEEEPAEKGTEGENGKKVRSVKQQHSFLPELAGRLHEHGAGAAGIHAPGSGEEVSAGAVFTGIPITLHAQLAGTLNCSK